MAENKEIELRSVQEGIRRMLLILGIPKEKVTDIESLRLYYDLLHCLYRDADLND